MEKDYEKMWSDMVRFIQENKGIEARKIWDDVVESAWKYDDLSS